jgi:hypothetical protein
MYPRILSYAGRPLEEKYIKKKLKLKCQRNRVKQKRGKIKDVHNRTHKVTPIGRYTDPDFSDFSEELILKTTIPDR